MTVTFHELLNIIIESMSIKYFSLAIFYYQFCRCYRTLRAMKGWKLAAGFLTLVAVAFLSRMTLHAHSKCDMISVREKIVSRQSEMMPRKFLRQMTNCHLNYVQEYT